MCFDLESVYPLEKLLLTLFYDLTYAGFSLLHVSFHAELMLFLFSYYVKASNTLWV